MAAKANEDVLAKYIQYRLGMLGEENSHHRFEELCFRLARATIASHLIPPSGPVSAGGDQGRDFETFRLDGDGGNVSKIIAEVVGVTDVVIFACTTQKGSGADIARKVRKDIDAACGRNPRPTVAYVFIASVALAPALRHNLQDWAAKERELKLELLDQRTIAELLADHPNQWLAEYYLAVPSDMLPRPSTSSDAPLWYEETRSRLKDSHQPCVVSHAELAIVVRCARLAWSSKRFAADDGLWLDLLADIWGGPKGLTEAQGLRAYYESFVYLLRGRERCGIEAHVVAYVEGLTQLDDLGLSGDAQCFASYLVAGVANGHVNLSATIALDAFSKLVGWIERRIESSPGPLVQSDLLVGRGSVVFSARCLDPVKLAHEEVAALADEAVAWWTRALDVGESLIGFPILRLANLVGNVAPVLSASADYDAFIDRLDRACESRYASEGLAATMRDRAMALYSAGNYAGVIVPLLGARKHWHNGDHIYGSVLATMVLAHNMAKLGLQWAAKRYFYDVIAVVERLGDRQYGGIVAKSVFGIAECQYCVGEWVSAVRSYELALALHREYEVDPWNRSKHEILQRSEFHLVNMLVAGELVSPGFRAWGEKATAAWDLATVVEQSSKTVRANWVKFGVQDPALSDDWPLFGAPLADLLQERLARWSALGVDWSVSWGRDYALEVQAIEFLSILQLLQASISRSSKHVMPTAIEVRLSFSADPVGATMSLGGEPFGVDVCFSSLDLTEELSRREVRANTVAAALSVLGLVVTDVGSGSELSAAVEGVVKDGVFVGASVLEGFAHVTSIDVWQDTVGLDLVPPIAKLSAAPKSKLDWLPGRSPLYSASLAESMLRKRYDVGFRIVAPVFAAYSDGPELRTFVERLRLEWLDWQIVAGLAAGAVSVACESARNRGSSEHQIEQELVAGKQALLDGSLKIADWSSDYEKAVELSLSGGMLSALGGWGLKLNYPKVDLVALRKFLAERFLHFDQDLAPGDRPSFPWE